MGRIRTCGCGGYYWVLGQAEIGTDVTFKNRRELLEALVRRSRKVESSLGSGGET
jgi:hypothetical protein